MATVQTEPDRSSLRNVIRRSPATRRWVLPTREWLFAILLLVGYVSLVFEHFQNLWRYRPHYEFAPFVALSIALLLWQRWPSSRIIHSPTTRYLGMLLIVAGVILLAVSVLLYSPYLAMISFACSSAGLLLRFGGVSGVRDLLPVWFLIWLTIPPPWGIDLVLVRTLQRFTSMTCSLFLDLFQVPHILQGNVIRLPNRELFVAEACSGVHSQLVLLAFAALLIVLRRRSLPFALALLGSSLFWAVVANTARVLMVSLILGLWGIDLSAGWRHEVMGYAVVAVGVLMVLSADQLLDGLFAQIWVEGLPPEDTFSEYWNRWLAIPEVAPGVKSEWEPFFETLRHGPVYDPQSPRLASWCLVAVSVILGLLQMAILVRRDFLASPDTGRLDSKGAQTAFDGFHLPEQNGQWKLISASTMDRETLAVVGASNRIWIYRRENNLARVAVDYPFSGWHELTECYLGIGWKVVAREVQLTPVNTGDESSEMHVEVDLRNASGEFGYLCFSLCDDQGTGLAAPERESTVHILKQKLRRSPIFSLMGFTPWNGSTPVGLQTQQFCVSPVPFTLDDKSALRANFVECRDRIWQRLKRRSPET